MKDGETIEQDGVTFRATPRYRLKHIDIVVLEHYLADAGEYHVRIFPPTDKRKKWMVDVRLHGHFYVANREDIFYLDGRNAKRRAFQFASILAGRQAPNHPCGVMDCPGTAVRTPRPAHVCGAQGFGQSIWDTCPACEAREAAFRSQGGR